MSWYPKAIQRNIPPGPSDPPITARVLIYHVRAGEGPTLYDYFNGPSGGVESHFYVRYSGVVEQYRDTNYQADANMRANDFAISVETEGLAGGIWTSEQITSLEELSVWCCNTHSIPRVQCPAWNGAGIGWHNLFPAEWAGGPRACPGAFRIPQIKNIILPYLQGDLDMQPDERQWLSDIARDIVYGADGNPSRLALVLDAVNRIEKNLANTVWDKLLTNRVNGEAQKASDLLPFAHYEAYHARVSADAVLASPQTFTLDEFKQAFKDALSEQLSLTGTFTVNKTV